MCHVSMNRERLKGNTDDDGDGEAAEQPVKVMKLEEVDNDANDQVGEYRYCAFIAVLS